MNKYNISTYPSSHPTKYIYNNFDNDDKPLQASSSFIPLHVALIVISSLGAILLLYTVIYRKEGNLLSTLYKGCMDSIKGRKEHKPDLIDTNRSMTRSEEEPLYHEFFGKSRNKDDNRAKAEWLNNWRHQKQTQNRKITSVISSVLQNDCDEIGCQHEKLKAGGNHRHNSSNHRHNTNPSRGVVVIPPAMMKNLCKHSISRGQYLSHTDEEFVQKIEEDNEIMSPRSKSRQKDMTNVYTV